MTQADEAHRARVLGEVKEDMLSAFHHSFFEVDDCPEILIKAITSGEIRHLSINF